MARDEAYLLDVLIAARKALAFVEDLTQRRSEGGVGDSAEGPA